MVQRGREGHWFREGGKGTGSERKGRALVQRGREGHWFREGGKGTEGNI